MPLSFSLVVVKGPDESRRVDLPAGARMILGRGSASGFQLKDDQVSRSHCVVDHGPSGPTVSDMDSRNGTFLNGRKIDRAEPLRTGDVIQIGNSTLNLEQTGEPDEPVPESPAYFCLSCGSGLAGPCRRCGPQFLTPPDGLPDMIIEERLGGGGMGTVFKGRRVSDDLSVALKVMAFVGEPRKDGLKRFFREAQIPKSLDHANIVQVYGTGAAQAKPPQGTLAPHQKPCKVVYIVLEYVEGDSVNKIVGEWGCLDMKDAVRIASSVADALALAAERGIVHRDIKPENIMITGDGTVKLMDFGLSKSFEDAGLSGVTKSGHALGTPVFMAPEQIQDARYADHRADIYSLGATLFYMLAGRHPFTGNRVREILFKVLEEPAPPLESYRPGIPPALSKIVAQCLEKDPEMRYPTALHLKKELDGILDFIK